MGIWSTDLENVEKWCIFVIILISLDNINGYLWIEWQENIINHLRVNYANYFNSSHKEYVALNDIELYFLDTSGYFNALL